MITTKKAIGYTMFGMIIVVIQGVLIRAGIVQGEWAPLLFEGLVAYLMTAVALAAS